MRFLGRQGDSHAGTWKKGTGIAVKAGRARRGQTAGFSAANSRRSENADVHSREPRSGEILADSRARPSHTG